VTPADPAKVVAAAREWLGTPYHEQASVIGVGCDCLGLARGVWREMVGPEPISIPPYSRDWGETGPREVLVEGARATMIEIAPPEAGSGALLLFRMRPGAIVKHIGIVLPESRLIHTYERLGVIEEALTPAWRRRTAFAFLFPRMKGDVR
jgi:NlpC/P60 family putative phage cell wall peptidase